jgi:hypothetical protein
VIQSEQPELVTFVACPPSDMSGPTANAFIDSALDNLNRKKPAGHRILRAASIRDLDVALCKLLSPPFRGQIRLQIVGHSLSGILSLGALWLQEPAIDTYPFYVLDTNPAALGLLAKYIGKISEVMLVGCNIGSAASFGYAINGRTLTYTLAELLHCKVRGADDIVSPDEFDAHGWYSPGALHRRPKGWRWVDGMPPSWIDPGTDDVRRRAQTITTVEVRAITGTRLPVPAFTKPVSLEPALQLSCLPLDGPPPSALAEVTLDTDQGPGQLLCGGRYLRLSESDACFAIEQQPALSALLTERLWQTTGHPSGHDHDEIVSPPAQTAQWSR